MGMVSFISTVPSLVSLVSSPSTSLPLTRDFHSVSPSTIQLVSIKRIISTVWKCQGTVNCRNEGDWDDGDRFSRRRVLHCFGATIGIVSLFVLHSTHNDAHHLSCTRTICDFCVQLLYFHYIISIFPYWQIIWKWDDDMYVVCITIYILASLWRKLSI